VHERLGHLGGPVDERRQRHQRDRGHGRRPHGHLDAVDALAHAAGDDVADRPRQGCGERDEEGRDRHRRLQAQPDDGESGHSDDDAQHLPAARNLAEGEGGDDDGEGSLDLDDDRGQPGRQPEGHGCVEQRELSGGHEHPDEQDTTEAAAGEANEDDGGDDDEGEACSGEQHRRPIAQTDVDEDEVDAPENDDEQGEHDVNRAHGPRISAR
jgi:hypothetical protein